MSCGVGGSSCETPRRRGELVMLAIMTAVFIVLSIFSFLKSRGQVTPDTITYGTYTADQGKHVFQAYNCMGCHTLLGNGAYLGPDLTNTYELTGPAWLEAFLPSAGGWPTGPAVLVNLQRPETAAASNASSLEEYFKNYPAAAERVQRRGGTRSHMPNLQFRPGEVGQLIAFLKYTSQMNTEGWPPKPKVDGLQSALATPMPGAMVAAAMPAAATAADTPTDPAALGAQIVVQTGCTACHATDASKMIGPGWGGLFGSTIALADGSSIVADDAYLVESIRNPDAHVAAGYPAGTMISYDAILDQAQIEAIVAYIRTLPGEGQ